MKTRVISGICIGALVIVSLALGGWFSYGLCLALSLVGLYELYKRPALKKVLLQYADILPQLCIMF